jgi:hypothetical protein
MLAQFLSGEPREDVGGTACRKRHNHSQQGVAVLRAHGSKCADSEQDAYDPRKSKAQVLPDVLRGVELNKEINAGLADPKLKARLVDLGGTVSRFRQAHRWRLQGQ